MKITLLGYPGPVGGACTEAFDTIKLWRLAGWEVFAIPTWGAPPADDRAKLDALGVTTIETTRPEIAEALPADSVIVEFCNRRAFRVLPQIRSRGLPYVHVPCMTTHDARAYPFHRYGFADAVVFQSGYQRATLGGWYRSQAVPLNDHLIRGAFFPDDWTFAPRPRNDEPFIGGKLARAHHAKWSADTFALLGQLPNVRAELMGVDYRVAKKLGPPPAWATLHAVNAMPVREFYPRLHCLLTVNGGDAENWPRVGLEAMACGVPIVAPRQWGWLEMISDSQTGMLALNNEEIGAALKRLDTDEDFRLELVHAARRRLNLLCDPQTLIGCWQRVWNSLRQRGSKCA